MFLCVEAQHVGVIKTNGAHLKQIKAAAFEFLWAIKHICRPRWNAEVFCYKSRWQICFQLLMFEQQTKQLRQKTTVGCRKVQKNHPFQPLTQQALRTNSLQKQQMKFYSNGSNVLILYSTRTQKVTMYLKRTPLRRIEKAPVSYARSNIKRIPRSRSKYRCHTREVAYYVTMPLNCFDLAIVVSVSHVWSGFCVRELSFFIWNRNQSAESETWNRA